MPQPFHHRLDRRLLLVVHADPTQSNAERDKIGAQGGFRLRPDPPGRPVVTTAALCVSGSKRGLSDAAQPVQGRDSDAAFVAFERRLDRCERIVAPHEMPWDTDGDVRQRSGESLGRPRGGRPG